MLYFERISPTKFYYHRGGQLTLEAQNRNCPQSGRERLLWATGRYNAVEADLPSSLGCCYSSSPCPYRRYISSASAARGRVMRTTMPDRTAIGLRHQNIRSET
eukprot:scaffold6161_cov72-Phaeocystis_antarctica.AAC.6